MSAVPAPEPASTHPSGTESQPLLGDRSPRAAGSRRGSAAARFAGLLGFASGTGALLAGKSALLAL